MTQTQSNTNISNNLMNNNNNNNNNNSSCNRCCYHCVCNSTTTHRWYWDQRRMQSGQWCVFTKQTQRQQATEKCTQYGYEECGLQTKENGEFIMASLFQSKYEPIPK
eukprot:156825_1